MDNIINAMENISIESYEDYYHKYYEDFRQAMPNWTENQLELYSTLAADNEKQYDILAIQALKKDKNIKLAVIRTIKACDVAKERGIIRTNTNMLLNMFNGLTIN